MNSQEFLKERIRKLISDLKSYARENKASEEEYLMLLLDQLHGHSYGQPEMFCVEQYPVAINRIQYYRLMDLYHNQQILPWGTDEQRREYCYHLSEYLEHYGSDPERREKIMDRVLQESDYRIYSEAEPDSQSWFDEYPVILEEE